MNLLDTDKYHPEATRSVVPRFPRGARGRGLEELGASIASGTDPTALSRR